jgi:hypothetical protein
MKEKSEILSLDSQAIALAKVLRVIMGVKIWPRIKLEKFKVKEGEKLA